jgi:hypothetical protein
MIIKILNYKIDKYNAIGYCRRPKRTLNTPIFQKTNKNLKEVIPNVA